MTEQLQKSPHYVLVIDESRNKILSILYTFANRDPLARIAFNMACRQFGVSKEDLKSFIKDWADKEHELGWCDDPTCPDNNHAAKTPETDAEKYAKVAIPTHICTCGYRATASAEIMGDSRPEAKSISICFGCGKLWVFNADRTLREPTEAEMKQIMASPEWELIQHSRKMIEQVKKQNGG